MHTLLHLVSLVLNAALVLMLFSLALGFYRLVVRRPLPPTGDPQLGESLRRHSSKWSSRRLAAVWVDLADEPDTRMAFLGADADRVFELGSVTKALTGLLIADAVDRGELSLDSRLGDLDPQVTGALADQTMQSLVTHTSGLPRVPASLIGRAYLSTLFGLDPYPRRGPNIENVASRARLKPSPRHAYSNVGGALAGQVVAHVAATNYHELMRERLFGPLGMEATSTDPAHHRVARGWTSAGRGAFPWVMDGYSPCGGAVSTAADMARLAEALLRGTAPGMRALDEIPGVQIGTTDAGIATFWMVDHVPESNRRMVWHNGQTGGYSSFFALFPEAQRAVVVLSDTAAAPITQRTATAIARDMVDAARSRQQPGTGPQATGNTPGQRPGDGGQHTGTDRGRPRTGKRRR